MKQVTRCHFYFYFLIIGGRCGSGCQKCLCLSCCCTQYKCCYSNDIIILNDTWTIKMTVYVFIFITWKCILVLLWTNDTALLVLSRWLKAALVILWLWKQTVCADPKVMQTDSVMTQINQSIYSHAKYVRPEQGLTESIITACTEFPLTSSTCPQKKHLIFFLPFRSHLKIRHYLLQFLRCLRLP